MTALVPRNGSPATLVEEALDALLTTAERRDPLVEAQVAVLEAGLMLTRAGAVTPSPGQHDRVQLLREALGSVRAAVMATGVAVVRSNDAARMAGADAG
ncbi:hypothetical protein [Streptomyces murinus]|uniref:hypothetical protein n=1 Tax=Streptomyces murinus TaxID=33900 RepID=UPI0021146882|nr:hypothetical protein [Streptomyces murinus]